MTFSPTPHRIHRALLPVLAFVVLLVGCATNPLTGKRQLMLVSQQAEIEMGLQAVKAFQNDYGVVEDPELRAFVARLGSRLLPQTPTPGASYEYFIVDQPEPNAFAAPGGKIFVSRGVLTLVNSEAELAGVIGHEIAHVIGRHTASRMTSAMGAQLLTLGAVVGAAAAGGSEAADLAAKLGGTGTALFVAGYGRDQERESDYYGQGFAHAAGYDPTAMASFFQTMDALALLDAGDRRMPGWLDTHPATPERVANAKRRAADLLAGASPPPRGSRAELLRRLDGITVGRNPAEGIFRDSRFLHPDLDFTLLFPSGWKTQNTRKAVGAVSPQEDALFVLEVEGAGSDPAAAARKTLQEANVPVLEQGPLAIGGRPAYSARVQVLSNGKELLLELTWIAHGGSIFRTVGLTTATLAGTHMPTLRSTARSFRSLTRAERRSIEWKRMRLARAREGESLAALSKRTGNRWNTEETAVVNAIDPRARLRSGQLIKISQAEPYPGR